MREVVGMGVGGVFIGLLGYRLFHVALSLYGFVLGASLGLLLVGPLGSWLIGAWWSWWAACWG